jgi:hypothetical protein
MPIPDLNDHGFLPSGIHDCSLEDIGARFGTFQSTDRRSHLYRQLQVFLAEVHSTNLVVAVIVNGSFVTRKPDPGDIDLILVLSSGHDFTANLQPMAYNVLSKRRVRGRYGFDILVARENGLEYEQYLEFFQQVRGQPSDRKGVLRIPL